jgi:hypothetical protein
MTLLSERSLRRKTVKRTILGVISGLLFVIVSLSQGPSAQAAQCSQGAAAGKYGFTLTGILILPSGPVPIAAVGVATVDASGNVTGTEARSVGGGFANETFSGTYSVNSDCTGSMTLNFYESGNLVRTSVLSTVADNNSKELRMVQRSLTLPNSTALPVVITVEARKIFTDED